jgi:hypothetical protein
MTVLGYAESNISFSLVTELMHGNFRDRIHGKMYNEDRILDFPTFQKAVDTLLRIAGGMRILCKNRNVHRDLKATNILVKVSSARQVAPHSILLGFVQK